MNENLIDIYLPRKELEMVLARLACNSMMEDLLNGWTDNLEDIIRLGSPSMKTLSNGEILKEISDFSDGNLMNIFYTMCEKSPTFNVKWGDKRKELSKADRVSLYVSEHKVLKRSQIAAVLAQHELEVNGVDPDVMLDIFVTGCPGWANKSAEDIQQYIKDNELYSQLGIHAGDTFVVTED